MRPIIVTVGPLASASANNICTSQSLGAAGNLTINGALASGGVATLDKPRRVLITSAGNDSGMTFTISGTNWSGNPVSETLTGGNAAAVASVLDYATVTKIAGSAATASTVTVGTNAVAASPWIRLDDWSMSQTALQAIVSGTVNYTVQQTLDDPNDPTNPVAASAVAWVSHPDTNLVGATANVQGNYNYSPRYVRVLLNSGSGSVTLTANQAASVTF